MTKENKDMPDENEMEISKMFNEIRQSIQDVDAFEYQLGLVTTTEIEVKKKIHDLAKFGTHFVIAFKNEELAKSQSIPIDKLEEKVIKEIEDRIALAGWKTEFAEGVKVGFRESLKLVQDLIDDAKKEDD